jgi:hypothetical protein
MTATGNATVPCQTFFSGEEFLHSIDDFRVHPFMPQCTPTVEGFITAMYNGKLFLHSKYKFDCLEFIQVMLLKRKYHIFFFVF